MRNTPVQERLLVCADWPYARSSTDAEQVAASILPSDIFARYHRMSGHMVLTVLGGDMAGAPSSPAADHAGSSAQESALRCHQRILPIGEQLGVEFDLCANSTNENHSHCTQEVFLKLLDRGYIVKDSTDAPYCASDKRFVPDHSVEGTCPYCNFASAHGDCCENCGRRLDPAQLLDPRCRLCDNSRIEMCETEHFFLDLPQFADALRQWLQSGKEHWRPGTLNFALKWLQEGLVPHALTHDLDSGISVPLPGYEAKRFSVWFDAVLGYYSATVEWAQHQGDSQAWTKWWDPKLMGADPPARTYYFTGRDNLAVHTILWPAVLMGLGDMALPYDVTAVEFIAMGDFKSSHRQADSILVEDALNRYSADSLRFYLTSALPEERGASFSYQDLVHHNNDQLVATYGNVVHRTLTFLQRSFSGTVPQPGPLRPRDKAIVQEVQHGFAAVGDDISRAHLRDGLEKAMEVARSANRYLEEQAPWKRMATDLEATATTMYVMLQVLNGLKVLFAPYLPFSSQKLHQLLGYSGQVSNCSWEATVLHYGQQLPTPSPLFRKFETPVTFTK